MGLECRIHREKHGCQWGLAKAGGRARSCVCVSVVVWSFHHAYGALIGSRGGSGLVALCPISGERRCPTANVTLLNLPDRVATSGCLVSQPPGLLTSPQTHLGVGERETPPCLCVLVVPAPWSWWWGGGGGGMLCHIFRGHKSAPELHVPTGISPPTPGELGPGRATGGRRSQGNVHKHLDVGLAKPSCKIATTWAGGGEAVTAI